MRTSVALALCLACALPGWAAEPVPVVFVDLTFAGEKVEVGRPVAGPQMVLPGNRGVPRLAPRWYEITSADGVVIHAGRLPDPRRIVVEYTTDESSVFANGGEIPDEHTRITLCVPALKGRLSVYARKPGKEKKLLGAADL